MRRSRRRGRVTVTCFALTSGWNFGRVSFRKTHSRWLGWEKSSMMAKEDQPETVRTATVTRLLNEAGAGDAQAAADLLPLVYEQLRALATKKMRRERPDQTMQATALVHEAYLRLV